MCLKETLYSFPVNDSKKVQNRMIIHKNIIKFDPKISVF